MISSLAEETPEDALKLTWSYLFLLKSVFKVSSLGAVSTSSMYPGAAKLINALAPVDFPTSEPPHPWESSEKSGAMMNMVLELPTNLTAKVFCEVQRTASSSGSPLM